ncbi:MAG: hypothetical protein ACLSA6_13270 [Holdemania massiliensis]
MEVIQRKRMRNSFKFHSWDQVIHRAGDLPAFLMGRSTAQRPKFRFKKSQKATINYYFLKFLMKAL